MYGITEYLQRVSSSVYWVSCALEYRDGDEVQLAKRQLTPYIQFFLCLLQGAVPRSKRAYDAFHPSNKTQASADAVQIQVPANFELFRSLSKTSKI